jgi:hypothetical protein
MVRKHIKGYLVIGLFLLSLGGVLIHYKVHDPSNFAFGYVPLFSGLISVLVIPLMFTFKRTLHFAHILNSLAAIIGIITMTHFSIAKAPLHADIAITIAKFLIGRAIFELAVYSNLDTKSTASGWQTLRYPNMGFWYTHLVLLSAVYALGYFLWR